ncbi:hypothetical protein ICW40_11955 [Actinotalea ferrariae]|nr:hypothetical protein [Actinotalea ferrariae]
MRGTDVGAWTGEAADAFAEALADAARSSLKAADDALAAARALDRHAAVVEWADDRLASAVPATAAEADLLLEDLRGAVDDSARAAAATLDELAQGIERMPDIWDFMAYAREQYWGGIGDSLAGIVESSWQVQLFRYATDPVGYVAEQQAMGQALWTGLREDPVGLAKDLVDWDTWRTDPLRAIGRQVPDIILTAATVGGGTGATGVQRLQRLATSTTSRAGDEGIEAPSGPPMHSLASPPGTNLTEPAVSSPKLRNIVEHLYRGTYNAKRVGDGTTMDALRRERITGEPTHGKFHAQKAEELLRGLDKWLRLNRDGNPHDRLVAQSLANELRQVLEGT